MANEEPKSHDHNGRELLGTQVRREKRCPLRLFGAILTVRRRIGHHNTTSRLCDSRSHCHLAIFGTFRKILKPLEADGASIPRNIFGIMRITNKVEAAYRRGDLFDKRRRLIDAWAENCAATSNVLCRERSTGVNPLLFVGRRST
jgi:hypothetical protein